MRFATSRNDDTQDSFFYSNHYVTKYSKQINSIGTFLLGNCG